MRVASLLLAVGLPLLLCAAASPPAPASAPRRIVSLDMCADQFVVALADPAQIAGLTEWSRDPQLSAVAARAMALPITHRGAEEVMALHPDMVIGAPFRTAAALRPLAAAGSRLIDMPRGEGVRGIEQTITTIAAAVGHPQRGAAMVARMRRELAAIGAPPGRGRVAAYYQRQGYLTGAGTLIDDMIRRVGLVNLAGRLDRPALSQVSLEAMALAQPDFLILDSAALEMSDLGTAVLRHPVLDRAVPRSRRLYIPRALTVCDGPAYPRAVALLAQQIRAVDGRRR